MSEFRKAGDEVAGGNMGRVESMLAHQALTLDAIFNNLAQRSHKQDTFKGLESHRVSRRPVGLSQTCVV